MAQKVAQSFDKHNNTKSDFRTTVEDYTWTGIAAGGTFGGAVGMTYGLGLGTVPGFVAGAVVGGAVGSVIGLGVAGVEHINDSDRQS